MALPKDGNKQEASQEPQKSKGGRPIVHDLNIEEIKKLAQMHCTIPEIAAFMGCSEDTLERRYAGIIKEGKEAGKASLRRMQWLAAQEGTPALLIWLGKQLLGQRDIKEVVADVKTNQVTQEEIKSELASLKAMLKDEA